MSVLGEMVTKGLPTATQQSAVEGLGDGSRSQTYVPDYTVEAATDLIIIRVSTEQYAGALHAASLDRHLRAVDYRDGATSAGGRNSDFSGTAGEFPTSSGAQSPLAEYSSRDQLLDSENSDSASKGCNIVNNQTKSCDV